MIRTVKKEIRVLGLAKVRLDGRVDVIGVVYRGKFLTDGILYFKAQELDTCGLSNLIKKSRHYEQIRVIVCNVEDEFNCKRLWEDLRIPVIRLNDKCGFDAYGIDKEIASRILKASSRINCKPDALRVAMKLRAALEETFKCRL